ncbi:ribonuclease p complex subunit [Diplodia corticola]|uniref:Ribonuclease P protein subunit n=1 Tax=Diplodia corticola TaxID=236234 RepID=A0A1J9QN29_9PEZI|nr:ribonuclease p complex subunit [Diplodia corticola]OJD29872.1 ribonuclease p complex subunit [Diplodia corticola]
MTSTPTAPEAPSAPINPSHALLSRAHSPDTTTRIFTDRVQKKPLLLRPTESADTPSTDARAARRLTRQRHAAQTKNKSASKPTPLSARQKRALGVHEIPKSQQRYEIFEGLHKMWVGYVREVLGLSEGGGPGYVSAASAGPKLASADFHGAEVEVVRSRCVGRVGLRGIVVKDRKFVFEVVTRGDVVKTIPKEHTVFRFEIPLGTGGGEGLGEEPRNLVFELHGSQFENRAPDRANKKFKQHAMVDL